MPHRHIQTGWNHFWRQIVKLARNPIFFVLTLLGNFMLFVCAFLFYLVERGINPRISGFDDALWWAFVTITTVGYGDTVPVTGAGRIVAVGLMLTGGVLFLTFIALLSSAFIELEFLELRRDLGALRARLEDLERGEP